MFTGMTATQKLAGIAGLSSYLVMGDKIQSLVPDGKPNEKTPFFMGHGDADPLVRYEWGVKTKEKLGEMGVSVDFKTYK